MPFRLKSLTPSEDGIQKAVVKALVHMGYVVLVSTRRVKRCSKCGDWQRGNDGASRGIPDLLISHPLWWPRMWLGAEMKSATGRLRPDQRVLADRGLIVVWRSLDDALATLRQLPGFPSGVRVGGKS